MPTTDHSTISPTAEQLQALTAEMNAWMKSTGRKNFPRAKQDELLEMGAKRCSRCTEVLRISEFSKNTRMPDNLQNNCRRCQNNMTREYNRERLANDPEFRERRNEHQREYHNTRYATDELFRMSAQLRDGKHRTLEAGGVVEDFGAADLLAWWEQHGIPADRDYFTNEPLDPATRSVDHLWAVAEGGPHARWALVPTAPLTNRMKGAKSPSEFRDWLRSEGIEPAERPDPTPFLVEALAARAAEQTNKEIDPLVQRAMSITVPARAKRSVLVQIEEGTDNE